MRRIRYLTGGLTCLFLCAAARAEAPPDPLRLIPDQADVILDVPQPRRLAETAMRQELLKQVRDLDAVREFLDSTNARRFNQLLAYFEREMGAQWPELLDRLAGGGAALGVKIAPNPAPALLVLQGTDEKQTQKFARLALQVLEQAAAQEESKGKLEKAVYRKVETVRVGTEFHAAVAGSAILISNNEAGLHAALDLHLDGGKKSMAAVASLAESRRQLPAGALARLWLNLETVRKAPQAKDVFTTPPADPNVQVLFGGILDVARRSPYLCAGLYHEKDKFVTTLRMPRGREGMADGLDVHVPPADRPGPRPLLEPKGVLFSSSFYLDVGKFWENRDKLFTAEVAKAFEEADKNSGRFLAGSQLSKLLAQAGSYHRLVVARQDKPGYKRQPKQEIPAFAFIAETREPEAFAKSMDTVLRGAALLAGSQFKLKLVEEKHGDRLITGYRFPEDGKVDADTNDLRFNFSPCFVPVGDQFVFCSTLELAHELVDLLEAEAKSGKAKGSDAASRSRLYGRGGAEFLKSIEDILLAQVILGQGLEPAAAKKEVQQLTDLVRQLGTLQIESGYGAKDWHYTFTLNLGK